MKLSGLLFLILFTRQGIAQEYNPVTTDKDTFSIALVQLLKCAVDNFNACKGAHLQYTMMQDNEYGLTIPFPNSAAAIVRSRDSYDNSAYVEFREYETAEKLREGMEVLRQKIVKALGDQLYMPWKTATAGGNSFISSFSIRDRNGYFQPNFELLTGSSVKPFLLPPPGSPVADTLKKHFILLKVEGRKPSYYHFIPAGIKPPEPALQKTLRELMIAATIDFDSVLGKQYNGLFQLKRKDTSLLINNYPVILKRSGENRIATLYFPVGKDTAQQWEYYHTVVKAATGGNYVYFKNSTTEKYYTHYFSKEYDPQQPLIYLQMVEQKDRALIQVTIRSRFHHPTKRSASLGDD